MRIISALAVLLCFALAAQDAAPAPDAPGVDHFVALLNNVVAKDAAVRLAAGRELVDVLIAAPRDPQKDADGKALPPKAPKPYLPQLKADLNSDQDAVRTAVLDKVTKLIANLRSNAKQYNKLAQDLNTAEHAHAVSIIATLLEDMFESEAVDALIEDLGAPDQAKAAAATQKLKEMGEDAAGSLVDTMSDADNPAVKRAAAEILKAMGPASKDSAWNMQLLLDNDDKLVRKLAAQVLENLGPDAAEVADDIVNSYLDYRQNTDKLDAEALKKFGPSYLDPEDKDIRRLAAAVLKKIGPAAGSAADSLADLLTNEDKSIRATASELLAGIGANAKDAADTLANVVDDKDADADARTRAANALAAIGPDAKDAVETLEKHKADADAAVAAAVQAALAKIQGAAVVAPAPAPAPQNAAVEQK